MVDQPPFSRLNLLQCDRVQLYNTIARLTLQFAVLGYTDLARRLVSKLNTYDYFHTHQVILLPLHLLWDMLGSWPDGEEERVRKELEDDRKRDAERSDKQDESERASKQTRAEPQNRPVTRSDVKAEVQRLADSYAKSWFRPGQMRSRLGTANISKDLKETAPEPSMETPAQAQRVITQILTAVDRMGPEGFKDAETGALAMDASSGLVNALNLRLRLTEQGKDVAGHKGLPSAEAILRRISKRLNANQQIEYLAQSQRAWRMLARGALADMLAIDKEKIEVFARELEDAIDERFGNGRLEITDATTHALLKTMELNSRTNPDADEGGPDGRLDADKTLFRNPATAQQIEETEERLGIKLPDDYNEFMLITNGFGAAFSGILFEPPLHPLSELRWLSDDEEYFTELPLDMPEDMFMALRPQNGELDQVNVGKAIEVGTEDIYNQWLIPPAKMNEVKVQVRMILDSANFDEKAKSSVRNMVQNFAGSEEKFWGLDWGFLTWASGGSASMVAYPSFKAYLRDVAESGVASNGDVLTERKFFGYSMLQEDSAVTSSEAA